MARKRTELPPEVNAQIAARTARGESAETIFHAIGRAISVPTIKRRQNELRGKSPNPTPKPSPPAEVADIPDEVPENTPTEDLNRWIARLEVAARQAEKQENWTALSSIASKVTALMALRHKSTPLPKSDPNDSPDMQALASQGEAKLLALVHGLFNPQ